LGTTNSFQTNDVTCYSSNDANCYTPRQLRAEKPKVANSVRRTGHTFGEKVLLSRQQREQQHGANSVSTKTLNNITNKIRLDVSPEKQDGSVSRCLSSQITTTTVRLLHAC
jgi:hypothetical protein